MDNKEILKQFNEISKNLMSRCSPDSDIYPLVTALISLFNLVINITQSLKENFVTQTKNFESQINFFKELAQKSEDQAKKSEEERFCDAIEYLINNEQSLRTFINNKNGVMHNNMTEQKFRPLDILRNSMLSNETVKGAENLALMYSFYQSCKLHGVNFEEYMKKVLAVMTMNMYKIIFEKNKNGTITGFKSHTISNEVLDKLMPWNENFEK